MARILVPVLALLGGCVHTYSIAIDGQQAQQSHYVLIEARPSGTTKVYDCMSMPDGKAWDPTCVRVDMRSSPPAADGRKDDDDRDDG